MVVFDPEKAKASIGIPEGKHELQVVSAKFGLNKSGNPMVTIELKNHLGQTGRAYISESQWSDNTIQRLLASAQSCGATIPAGYDFQVNENLAGFLQNRVRSLFVSVKEDGDYTQIKGFLVRPEVSPQEQAQAFDPFAQQSPAQGQQNLFAQAGAVNPPQAQAQGVGSFGGYDPLAGQVAPPEVQAQNPYAEGGIDQVMNQAFPPTQSATQPPVPPVQTPPAQHVDIPQASLDNMPFDTTGLQGTGAPAQPATDWSN